MDNKPTRLMALHPDEQLTALIGRLGGVSSLINHGDEHKGNYYQALYNIHEIKEELGALRTYLYNKRIHGHD